MPDLDGRLAELRADLRASVRQPAVDAVIERSRQRSAHRRAQLGAVAAVLVVGASIPILRTTLTPVTENPPLSTSEPPSPPPSSPYRFYVDFADAQHGFALRWECAKSSPYCGHELLATEDGGAHWQVRTLPAELKQTQATGVRLSVLGPRTAAVGPYDLVQDQRFRTTDAGQTWTPVPPAGSDTAATIPAAGILDFACGAPGPDCSRVLIAVDPDSGRQLPLRTKPPLRDASPASMSALLGGWWVAGTDPATGQGSMVVSRDAGRSWTKVPLPKLPNTAQEIRVSARGLTLYAAVTGGESNDDVNGLLAILRSTDGGRSWEQTYAATARREPRSVYGYPIAAADGRLIINTLADRIFASQDGGLTFTEQPAGQIRGWVLRTRGGGYLGDPFGSNVYTFSTDGVRWKEITIG